MNFYTIKTLSIAYIIVIQFILALVVNFAFDKFMVTTGFLTIRTEEQDHPLIKDIVYDFGKLLIIISVLGVVSYLGRIAIKKFPSPFNGLNGFNYYRLKELQEAGALTAFIFLTSKHLEERVGKLRQDIENRM